MTEDRVHDRLRLIHHLNQIQIFRGNHAPASQVSPQPIQQALPEVTLHENDRDTANLVRLYQGQDLHQLVQRPVATGHDDKGGGVPHEHDLAGEEMPEGLANILIGIDMLLVGKLDIQPHAGRFSGIGPLIRRLHNARPPARNHGKPRIGKAARQGLGQRVIRRPRRDTGTPKNSHRRLNARQILGALNKFSHNLEHAPRLHGGFLASFTGLAGAARLRDLVHDGYTLRSNATSG